MTSINKPSAAAATFIFALASGNAFAQAENQPNPDSAIKQACTQASSESATAYDAVTCLDRLEVRFYEAAIDDALANILPPEQIENVLQDSVCRAVKVPGLALEDEIFGERAMVTYDEMKQQSLSKDGRANFAEMITGFAKCIDAVADSADTKGASQEELDAVDRLRSVVPFTNSLKP